MHMVGFLVNPIAGMGGRVGLKGTDNVVEEAIKRGATEVALPRARRFLQTLKSLNSEIYFFVPSGKMGEDAFKDLRFKYEVVYSTPQSTTAQDTRSVCEIFLREKVDMIVFVGGDGTARDVVSIVHRQIPVLGIPAGVKMYSSVFAVTPEKGAYIVDSCIRKECNFVDSEVLDIDEESYRKNKFSIKLFGYARTPAVRDYVQSSKSEYGGEDEELSKEEIGEYVVDNMEKDVLYIIGAGTTTAKIAEKMGCPKTLLGVDAYYNGRPVTLDLDEKGILKLMERYPKVKLIVTPIGSQGFVFGRGNQQISERVLRKIGKENVIIIATPTKLKGIKKLRIDMENAEFMRGYYYVLHGYGRYKLMKME